MKDNNSNNKSMSMSMINPKINMHKIIKNRDNSRENQFNK